MGAPIEWAAAISPQEPAIPILYDSVRKASQLPGRELEEIAEKLRRQVAGDVRVDRYSCLLYATDASMYQMEPVGVVLPRSADDVEATVRVANEHGVPVLPRGGGTGLSGQTVNHAIVIDFSKYMRNVVEVQPEERWARVQPGMVLNHLGDAVARHGLHYAPDPVTRARATIGGGIGNNSCGTHSVIYGKTLDHILGVETVLSDGSRASFASTGGEALEDRMALDGLEGQLYREVRRIAHEHRDEVARRFPKVLRRVGGYNLDDFTGGGPMNLARMAVGSEGTLVVVTEAKVNLVPLPRKRGVAAVHFMDLRETMEATISILEHEPAAIEWVGSMIIDNCRSNFGFRHLLSFVEGEPQQLLLVEFFGETEAEVEAKLAALKGDLSRRGAGYATVTTTDPARQRQMWELREAGLGLVMSVKGDTKPLPYVEDTAVSPERLPEYVARFEEIVRAHDTEAAFYGHASTGCLHIRPMVNVKTPDGLDKMESIANQVSDLVLEFGGSLSGEHGDGIVRGAFTEKMFGSEIYGAFKELKAAFDPDGLLNPGKIIETPSIREFLRLSPVTVNMEVATYQDFSEDGGMAGAIEQCNGQGACRRMDGGMCPSFMVTREEEHSTRGRANLMRMVMAGVLPPGDLAGERLHRALELCIECKACKAECPSNVDMAKLKAEVLAKYQEAHGVPLRSRLFGEVARLAKLGSAAAPASNWLARLPVVSGMAKRWLGIHADRPLPTFARRSFTSWFESRRGPESAATRGEVVLFNDTFTEYMHPEVGQAATRVLEAVGYTVTLVRQKRCCGRPLISTGQLAKARDWARQNVDVLVPYAERGVPIVGVEPSCLLTLREEYPSMLRDDGSRAVAAQALLLDELLAKAVADDPGVAQAFRGEGMGSVQFHGHCHQKAEAGTASTLAVLRTTGYEAELIDSGCCGMAGTFGFEVEHYEMSRAMGALKLFPAVEAPERRDWGVAITGISCRQQIGHFTSKRPRHVAEYLADALRNSGG